MSEGFHLLRLQDSLACARLQSPLYLNNSADGIQHRICQSADDGLSGNRCSIFKLLKWMFPPTTLLRFGHQPTSSRECAEGFGIG
jgi:hypothetical protein